jgi:enoyl-CoA hydratase/carnithine racemase
LHYYPGGLRRYVTRLGLTAAKKLFLTAMTIDAAEMLRIGFLTELVEPSDLPARTEVHLAAIDAVDPGTAALMKRHLHQIADGQVDYQALGQAYRDSLRSPELHRRLNALLK